MSNAGNACNSSYHASAYNSSCICFDDADVAVDEDVDVVDDEGSSTTIVDVTVAVVVIVLSSSSISSTSIDTSGVGTALDTLSFVVELVVFAVVAFVVFCFEESIIIFRNAD
jgi:hypothetical protein